MNEPEQLKKAAFSILILTIFFSGSRSQEAGAIRVNEDFRDAALVEILDRLESNYPIHLFYRSEWIPDTRYSIKFEQVALPDVLSTILEGTGLNFVIYYQTVVLAPEEVLNQEFSRDYFIKRSEQHKLISSNAWAGAGEIIDIGDSLRPERLSEVKITGTIVDQLTNEPLSGVNLHFETVQQTVTTDRAGLFRLSLPTGYNLLEISYVGYESQKVILRIYDSGELRIKLAPDAYELDEVLITGETDDNNVESVTMGIARLQPQQIETLPVFMGEPDVLKGLMTLPGISPVAEGAGGFNVRGGDIDQNLILQDEALIFNSSHALGFFSVFNSDAIREVELYKGHIPAQYGGRLSSVLNVKLKGYSNERLSGSGGIGLVSSRLVLEGPLRSKRAQESGRSAKTSFLLGGRITYSDWVLGLVSNPDVRNSSGYFYDLNAKVDHRYSEKGSIAASYYQSYDYVQFSDEYGFSWKNRAASLIWNHMIHPEISSNFSVSYGNNSNNSFEPSGIDAFNLDNGINNLRVKEELLISSPEKHDIITGMEFIYYDIQPDQLTPKGEQSTIIPESVNRDNGQEFAIFANDAFTINHLFSISYGLRYNLFQQVGPATVYEYSEGFPSSPEEITDSTKFSTGAAINTFQALGPRVSLKYSLGPTSSLKFSYNRTNQFIHLISNTTAAVPVDFWQVSDTYIAPEKSDNFSMGYFRNFSNNVWETSLEVYYRSMDNLVEYRDLPELLLNEHLETALLSGRGRSYGAELFIRRRKGKVNGWFSYAYARSFIKVDGPEQEQQVNRGEWYPSRLDRPNTLNIVFNVDFSKSSTFSFNFMYQTGRPITVPVSNYILDDKVIPHFGDRNDYRIPDYHRLDISYTLRRNMIKRKRYQDSFIFSIYNLYARRNAYSVYFRKERGSYTNAYKLSILGTIFPSITYNFKF